MVDGSLKEAKELKTILIWFEAVSGLKVNIKKQFYRVNSVEAGAKILNVWHCKEDSLPEVYIELPLGAKYWCISIWDPLIKMFRCRMALWKKYYLSIGG